MANPQTRHIAEYEANTKGSDLIIGDVHGKLACLNTVLNKLQQHDRLFIVGDLIDRGEDSYGVVKKIRKMPNVFVVRGNHEKLCLRSIRIMESVAKENKNNIESQMRSKHKIRSHIATRNGGQWLLDLFLKELADGKIKYADGVIQYSHKSRIRKIKKYFNSLPYIIHVKARPGVSAFNVVHADMPFNDKVLRERLDTNSRLSKSEKNYAMWARRAALTDKGRTASSIPAYCGHTILRKGTEAVRHNTNTIDLDGGCYLHKVFLLLNHTKQTVQHVMMETTIHEGLITALELIQNHLHQFKPPSFFKRFSMLFFCGCQNVNEPASQKHSHQVIQKPCAAA